MKGPLSAAMDEVRRILKGLLGTSADAADGLPTAGEALDQFYRAESKALRMGAQEFDRADRDNAPTIAGSVPESTLAAARPGDSLAVPLAEIRPAGVSRLIRNAHQPTPVEVEAMRRAYAAQTAIMARIGDRPPTLAEVRELLLLVNPTRSRTAGNCMECSWAVRDILAGRPAVAGPSGAQKFIEPGTERFQGDSHREIHETICEHLYRRGQNAIMSGNRYSDAFGHHYNVANIEGEIYYLDGQTGTVTEENIVPDGDYYVVFPMRGV
ncbi:toxin glutamine deamidase domain-containing protein [Nocardia asiatica]|uniref:toxin glutamine deamidase domain-containing protein n=1 Tax=Nocardia asiatica TaxID=209252 RepID=UPI003EE3B7BC